MSKKLNIEVGDKFHNLELVKLYIEKTDQGIIGQWKCMCGNFKLIINSRVVSGHTKSCGCLQKETIRTLNLKHNCANKYNESPEYTTWQRLRGRCLNPKNPNYPDYGGRGITISEKWNKFENFLADMGAKPSRNHSLDRIDNELGYYKENCRWVTQDIQVKNRRNTIKVCYNGEIMCLKDACKLLNLSYPKISRIYREKEILPINLKKYEKI